MSEKLMPLAIAGLVVVGASLTLTAADTEAGRGSVRHGSRKGAQRGATKGATVGGHLGGQEGAVKGATVGASRGATRGARVGAAVDPRSPARGSARAGYRAGYHHGRHDAYHHWEDARRDYYRWRTLTGLVKLGAYYSSRPKTTSTVVVTGTTYYYAAGVYYVQSGSGYVVTSAPPGAVVYAVPTHTTVVYAGTTPYYYVNGAYYVQTDAPAQAPPQETTVNVNVSTGSDASEHEGVASVEMIDDEENYEVVAPPVGATVPYLPDEAEEETIDDKSYFVYADTYYKPFVSDGETIYMVVEDPRLEA